MLALEIKIFQSRQNFNYWPYLHTPYVQNLCVHAVWVRTDHCITWVPVSTTSAFYYPLPATYSYSIPLIALPLLAPLFSQRIYLFGLPHVIVEPHDATLTLTLLKSVQMLESYALPLPPPFLMTNICPPIKAIREIMSSRQALITLLPIMRQPIQRRRNTGHKQDEKANMVRYNENDE